jgi:hypothetical protein
MNGVSNRRGSGVGPRKLRTFPSDLQPGLSLDFDGSMLVQTNG